MGKPFRCIVGYHSWKVEARYLVCKICGYQEKTEDGTKFDYYMASLGDLNFNQKD